MEDLIYRDNILPTLRCLLDFSHLSHIQCDWQGHQRTNYSVKKGLQKGIHVFLDLLNTDFLSTFSITYFTFLTRIATVLLG